MNVKDRLDKLINFYTQYHAGRVGALHVSATERYVRAVLGLKKKAPLTYRGFTLVCEGSLRWRERQYNGGTQTDIESAAGA